MALKILPLILSGPVSREATGHLLLGGDVEGYIAYVKGQKRRERRPLKP